MVRSSVLKTPYNSSTYDNQFGIANKQARHRLGLNHHTPPLEQNPLPFFNLLHGFTPHHPTHNRAVWGLNRGVQEIHKIIIGLRARHRPTQGVVRGLGNRWEYVAKLAVDINTKPSNRNKSTAK